MLVVLDLPCDCLLVLCLAEDGLQQMESDDEYEPTAEELAAEEEEEPLMMKNAEVWDNFLEYIQLAQADWAAEEDDTDLYRMQRAVEFFNKGACTPAPARLPPFVLLTSGCAIICTGNKVANDIHALKPTLLSWVPHVMCFVVPRQILELGDPSRRSCDACESFGAWLKQTIKYRTCRRRLRGEASTHLRRQQDGPASSSSASSMDKTTWKQFFKRGYIQQAFERGCVSERISHGIQNEPYLQRKDWHRLRSGKTEKKYERKVDQQETGTGDTPARPRNLKEILAEQGA